MRVTGALSFPFVGPSLAKELNISSLVVRCATALLPKSRTTIKLKIVIMIHRPSWLNCTKGLKSPFLKKGVLPPENRNEEADNLRGELNAVNVLELIDGNGQRI